MFLSINLIFAPTNRGAFQHYQKDGGMNKGLRSYPLNLIRVMPAKGECFQQPMRLSSVDLIFNDN